MSKTVKRVITVMLIGLIAILGATAEAHTRWVNGKPRTCSICDDPDDKDPTLTEVPDPALHPAVAELIVETELVRISCPDGTNVLLKDKVTLSAEVPSKEWEWNAKTEEARVKFKVSDDPLKELVFCDARVEILKMSATYNAYECTDFEEKLCPCSRSKLLLSTMKLNDCKVPRNAPSGTFYACDAPKIRHVHPTEQVR